MVALSELKTRPQNRLSPAVFRQQAQPQLLHAIYVDPWIKVAVTGFRHMGTDFIGIELEGVERDWFETLLLDLSTPRGQAQAVAMMRAIKAKRLTPMQTLGGEMRILFHCWKWLGFAKPWRRSKFPNSHLVTLIGGSQHGMTPAMNHTIAIGQTITITYDVPGEPSMGVMERYRRFDSRPRMELDIVQPFVKRDGEIS